MFSKKMKFLALGAVLLSITISNASALEELGTEKTITTYTDSETNIEYQLNSKSKEAVITKTDSNLNLSDYTFDEIDYGGIIYKITGVGVEAKQETSPLFESANLEGVTFTNVDRIDSDSSFLNATLNDVSFHKLEIISGNRNFHGSTNQSVFLVNLKRIEGNENFANMTTKSIKIPSLEKIEGEKQFNGVMGLEEIELPKVGNPIVSSKDNFRGEYENVTMLGFEPFNHLQYGESEDDGSYDMQWFDFLLEVGMITYKFDTVIPQTVNVLGIPGEQNKKVPSVEINGKVFDDWYLGLNGSNGKFNQVFPSSQQTIIAYANVKDAATTPGTSTPGTSTPGIVYPGIGNSSNGAVTDGFVSGSSSNISDGTSEDSSLDSQESDLTKEEELAESEATKDEKTETDAEGNEDVKADDKEVDNSQGSSNTSIFEGFTIHTAAYMVIVVLIILGGIRYYRKKKEYESLEEDSKSGI